ncbi:hypothetical protein MMC27_001545 [Xylographa pallens]|nr:hypothetical protein [Xylographa pallens]
MQAENITEALPQNVPETVPDICWEVSPEIIWASPLQDKEAPPQISATWGDGGGGSSSSDDDYAVRKTVDIPKKKQQKPRTLPTLADSMDQDQENRNTGDMGPLQIWYCPILAVAKFPYKFMKGSAELVEKVSWRYFASSKIWDRKWTIYFIYPPPSVSIKPLLLVPESDVRSLLEEINKDLEIQLDFPARAEERGFRLNFPDDSQPRPRFLGISSSQAAFKAMEKQVPTMDSLVKGTASLALETDDKSYAAFKMKMDLAHMATQKKTKASKEKKKFQRVQQKEAWCRQLRRTQRYLGIRPRSETNVWSGGKPPSLDEPGQSWEDYVKAKEKYDHEIREKYALPLLDTHSPVPYVFENSVVFVCVDVESYERSHGQITEIGIATLDTNDLIGFAPGPGGKDWMAKIRSRHFRIKERVHLVNKDFIIGCPDRFEKAFGESEFISIHDAPAVVASCFRPPFSGPVGANLVFSSGEGEIKRKIILVGHDTKTDINYLRDLGYDPGNLSNLLEVLDTSEVFRALKCDTQAGSLGNLLCDLGLTGWNLHNAGNDAAYTLQALIGIAFKALAPKEERQAKSIDERTEEAMTDAADRVAEEDEEWGVAVGEDDGGPAEYKMDQPKNQEGRGGYRGGRGGGTRGDRGGSGRGRGSHDNQGGDRGGGGRGRGSHDNQGGDRGRGGRGRGSHDSQDRGGVLLQPRGNSRTRYQDRKAQEHAVEQREREEILARHTATQQW